VPDSADAARADLAASAGRPRFGARVARNEF